MNASCPRFGSSRNTSPRRREAVAAFILAGAWGYISLCSMKKDIRRGRSVVYSLTVHLVFVTKYRRNAITDRVRDHLGGTLGEVCAKRGCALREFDGEDDHVHLLVDYPPKLAISRLVNSLKLVSARFLRKRNFPEVRRKLCLVFIGIESPDTATLISMQKKQNTRRSLADSVHRIYQAGMVVIAGFIVGFDNEGGSVADAM